MGSHDRLFGFGAEWQRTSTLSAYLTCNSDFIEFDGICFFSGQCNHKGKMRSPFSLNVLVTDLHQTKCTTVCGRKPQRALPHSLKARKLLIEVNVWGVFSLK